MNIMNKIFKYENSVRRLLNPENISAQKYPRRNINAISYKLLEIGISKPVSSLEHYGAGQTFIHRLFGYRGVLLFPWHVRYFDHSNKKEDQHKTNKKDHIKNHSTQIYYQALMDNRDALIIKPQYEGLKLSSIRNNNEINSNTIIDYVSSEDILPYTSTEKMPIENDSFSNYLMQDSESNSGFIAREALKLWQEQNLKCLECSDVITQTSDNIRVTVIPFYIGLKEKKYQWQYLVRVENLDKQRAVILRGRNWSTLDDKLGKLGIIGGTGVVGKEPCLNSEFPAFQYSSTVDLESPTGSMWGSYKFEKEDGSWFEAKIPIFQLNSREDDNVEKPPFI